jgi:hypothetical protein
MKWLQTLHLENPAPTSHFSNLIKKIVGMVKQIQQGSSMDHSHKTCPVSNLETYLYQPVGQGELKELQLGNYWIQVTSLITIIHQTTELKLINHTKTVLQIYLQELVPTSQVKISSVFWTKEIKRWIKTSLNLPSQLRKGYKLCETILKGAQESIWRFKIPSETRFQQTWG